MVAAGSKREVCMSDHSTRVALVTGTSSGIGEAVARELLRRNWRVVGASRRAAVIEDPRYTHLRIDLGNVTQLAGRVEAAASAFVKDASVVRVALVNCAADPGLLGPLGRIDPVEMQRVYAVNVAAPIWLMGWIVARAARGSAVRIVNVSSGAASKAIPGLGVYASTKAALRMAGMVLASELDSADRPGGPHPDASILSYEPGVVDTAMQAAVRASSAETLPAVQMFKRLAAEGLLVPPERPAKEIADYLDHGKHARFAERRLGGEPDP